MALEPMQSDLVFGIDLGTTNSAVSVYHRGQQVILRLKGQKSLPSVVYISKGESHVGQHARNRAMIQPNNTISSAKRQMGTAHTWTIDGATYSPTHIATMLLNHMADALAEETQEIDLGGRPHHVVITVPANFTDPQKQATREAAEAAGLHVLELIEEPVAAALAYAAKQGGVRNVLVYDLGGGTFDVSILEVTTTKEAKNIGLKVLSKDGVPQAGGDDFDHALMKIAAADFQAKTGIELLNESKDQGFSPAKQREALQKLKLACEKIKLELSDATSAQLLLPDLIMDENGDPQSIELEITRAEFEAAIAPLIDQTREAVQRALDAAHKTTDDIDRVILVGGSTRVPAVKQLLTNMFGKEPYGNIDPDTAVAAGAAMYGAILQNPSEAGSQLTFTNIVTHHLGVLLFNGHFDWLLNKGDDIPDDGLFASNDYTNPLDNMKHVKISVYQTNEATPPQTPDDTTTFVGDFWVGVPQVPANHAQIAVRFEIDRSNMLTVTARSETDQKDLKVQRG